LSNNKIASGSSDWNSHLQRHTTLSSRRFFHGYTKRIAEITTSSNFRTVGFYGTNFASVFE
jgi:hypothetical protein